MRGSAGWIGAISWAIGTGWRQNQALTAPTTTMSAVSANTSRRFSGGRGTRLESSARSASLALSKRCVGLILSSRLQNACSQCGRSGRTFASDGGGRTMRWITVSAGVPPANGSAPVSIS